LTSPEERKAIIEYIKEASDLGVSERSICFLLGFPRRTIQHWRKSEKDRRKGSQREVSHRLTIEEKNDLFAIANSKEFVDKTPEQIIATLAQNGVFIASVSSLYRILRHNNALKHRQESKKPMKSMEQQDTIVSGSNQVWAWDITWLRKDIKGHFLYAYSIIDLYDRTLVGWSIEESESCEYARDLFRRVIRDQQVIPEFVHADNGHPMRGESLASFLNGLLVKRSHSRPRVSDDNAHIESWHKTLKYKVGYPKVFTSLEHGREWFAKFVNWYNHDHQHSGIGYVTPNQMRIGAAEEIFEKRKETMVAARNKNPLRWRQGKIRSWRPDEVICKIRLIKEKKNN